ncbi:MAG: OBAP family protein [Candidatus Eremiobacteraeota bacterium]|nr:OBAP family protein [Candidatus Eremiobacteraeota bacterium]
MKLVLGTFVVVAAAYGVARLGEAANSPAMMKTAGISPASGFTLHIDAKRHFPGNPQFIAHHWCRPAAGGITQCQLYDSDAANARLVGVEVVVPTATYKTFSQSEQALWHYHRTEIPKVSATMPGLSPAAASKVMAGMQETYGKVYLLWDASAKNQPQGQPFVYVLK